MGMRLSSSSVTPARHPMLTPYIFPIGVSVPTPKGRTPQYLQKKCTFLEVLNLYSVSADSPARRRKCSGVATAGQNLVLRQMEQLHRYEPCARSSSASKFTTPQWQLPL